MGKVSYGQSGYIGCKMSERAQQAYCNGEKPFSKWSKADILRGLEYYADKDVVNKMFKKYSADTLRYIFLEYTGWHHTGSYANITEFYQIAGFNSKDLDRIINELDEKEKELKEFRKRQKEEKRLLESTEEKCYFEFGVWSGTKKHPKLDYHKAFGVKKGNWIYYKDGSLLKKKKASGNYVNILQTYNRAPKGKAYIFNRIKKELKKRKGGK